MSTFFQDSSRNEIEPVFSFAALALKVAFLQFWRCEENKTAPYKGK